MILRCPMCGADIDLTQLRLNWGVEGGPRCPKCLEQVRYKNPYGPYVAIISLFIGSGIMALIHVQSYMAFFGGAVLLSIPVSLFLNAASVRVKAPALERWKPRRKTFFEWLYERDAPQDLFNKRPRP